MIGKMHFYESEIMAKQIRTNKYSSKFVKLNNALKNVVVKNGANTFIKQRYATLWEILEKIPKCLLISLNLYVSVVFFSFTICSINILVIALEILALRDFLYF